MPIARYSAKIDSDGRVRVIHVFLGANESAVDDLQQKHAGGCKAYGPAVAAEQTIDMDVDVDVLPEANEPELMAFLDIDEDTVVEEDADTPEDEEDDEEDEGEGDDE